jgi:hypothetical protein
LEVSQTNIWGTKDGLAVYGACGQKIEMEDEGTFGKLIIT